MPNPSNERNAIKTLLSNNPRLVVGEGFPIGKFADGVFQPSNFRLDCTTPLYLQGTRRDITHLNATVAVFGNQERSRLNERPTTIHANAAILFSVQEDGQVKAELLRYDGASNGEVHLSRPTQIVFEPTIPLADTA